MSNSKNVEKPKKEEAPSNLVNAGIYIFNRDIFEKIEKTGISERGEYEITDVMKRQSNRQFYVRKGTGACFHIAPPHVGEFHADQLGTSRFLTGRQSRPGGGLFPPSAAPRPRGGRVPFSI